MHSIYYKLEYKDEILKYYNLGISLWKVLWKDSFYQYNTMISWLNVILGFFYKHQ